METDNGEIFPIIASLFQRLQTEKTSFKSHTLIACNIDTVQSSLSDENEKFSNKYISDQYRIKSNDNNSYNNEVQIRVGIYKISKY